MSVYVDSIRRRIPSRAWPWATSCHLFGDELEELHQFAAELRLKREWFRGEIDFPHYDLTYQMRLAAMRFGAVVVSSREVVGFRRRWRAARLAKKIHTLRPQDQG